MYLLRCYLALLLFSTTLFASTYSVPLTSRQLCDYEMLSNGSFAPLTSFLKEDDYKSVLSDMRLVDGSLWPMPVVLDISKELAQKLKLGDLLELKNVDNTIAVLKVGEIYYPNKEEEALAVYRTKDPTHAGVNYLVNQTKEAYIAGEFVSQIPIEHYSFEDLRMAPKDLKKFFNDNQIDQVVAFQTRNPMHRAHVELTKLASNQTNAHLLIQPIVGLTKPGDVDSFSRVRCYREILKRYPKDKVTLNVLPLAMRMAGPREALWHALIRKNYGATHFIVGRDHAGPGVSASGTSFYGPYEAQELVNQYSDELGIEMIPFKEVVYLQDLDCYLPRDQVSSDNKVLSISGTELRHRLKADKEIPSWLSYPEVIAELKCAYPPTNQKGFTLFFTGLSGAGKSTIAQALSERLSEIQKRSLTLLDGDIIRKHVGAGLGFSKEDRSKNVRRVGFIANEVCRSHGAVICSLIAPYTEDRTYNRELISQNGEYIEVFVSTPLEECEKRDVKGLYEKARTGLIAKFTGISDPYEEPQSPEITLDTENHSVRECVDVVVDYLKDRGLI